MDYLHLLVLVIILVASCSRRSYFSLIELAIFILHTFYYGSSFAAYLTAKFLAATLFFVVDRIIYWKDDGNRILFYLLGFRSQMGHAAFEYKKKLYQYATRRADDQNGSTHDQDLSTELVPEVRDTIPKVRLRQPVGFSSGDFDTPSIKKVLQACGKCHNWALISLYSMSTDKFFSYGLLSSLRWETWIFSAILGFAYYYSITLDPLVDLFLLALFLFDTLNINPSLLKLSSDYRKQRSKYWWIYESFKLFLHFGLLHLLVSVDLYSRLSPAQKYVLMMATTVLVAIAMNLWFEKYVSRMSTLKKTNAPSARCDDGTKK
jgi:hypothetical protein